MAALCDLRDQLAEVNSRGACRNDTKGTPVFGRRGGLGITRIQMAGRTPEKNKYDRLGARRCGGQGRLNGASQAQRQRQRRTQPQERAA